MDTIVARIEFAFAHVPRPSNHDLTQPGSGVDFPTLQAVEDWHELTDEAIEQEPDALALLGAEGFRHFLPAYMRWICLHADEQPGSPVIEGTFEALTPQQGDTGVHSQSRFSLLGAEQSACIAAFLERVADHPGAHDARAYWRMRAGYLPEHDQQREA